MKFYNETPVLTADEEKVGQIDRVVIDPSEGQVSHLIVKKGFFFPEDKVLPVDLVAEADAERVVLKKTKDQLDLKTFSTREFISVDELEDFDEGEEEYDAVYRNPYYAYPAIGTTAAWGAAWYFDAQSVEVVKRNIPGDAIALKQGAKVYSSYGEHVGEIDSVFTNEDDSRVTHFVISRGVFFETRKLIPVFWIKLVKEDQVYLGVHSDTLNRVPDFDTKPEAQ